MVRLRQLIDRALHRLMIIPILIVASAIVVSQIMLAVDRDLADDSLPPVMETTVGSGRAILTAISSGLISSITLLLSLMLLVVQLASSQFSPRTLRDWIGDRTQQVTIGVVLGTTVYCLLVLRQIRTIGEGEELTPHLSVLLALVGGVLSLVAVVRSVDHVTDSLRIGRVAGNIVDDTVAVIDRNNPLDTTENPAVAPAPAPVDEEAPITPPPDAVAITAPAAGWVQQIDEAAIAAALEPEGTGYIAVALGSYTLPNAPMVWVWPPPPDDRCRRAIRAAVAIGDTRTMQQDIGFGIVQLVDIALRALSPGVNDPNTANDITVHLGVVLLALWERPVAPATRRVEDRTVIRHDLTHEDYLEAAIEPIRRYGAGDSDVAATLIRTLITLRDEVVRRGLPGPLEPIDRAVERVVDAHQRSDASDHDKGKVRALISEPSKTDA